MATEYVKSIIPNSRIGGFSISISNETTEGVEPSVSITGWALTVAQADIIATELIYTLNDLMARDEINGEGEEE